MGFVSQLISNEDGRKSRRVEGFGSNRQCVNQLFTMVVVAVNLGGDGPLTQHDPTRC